MSKKHIVFDHTSGEKIVRSFAGSTGIHCSLYNNEMIRIYSAPEDDAPCSKCENCGKCESLHIKGIQNSQRFGGRYIYSCFRDKVFCASPITMHGYTIGGIICGPIDMLNTEPYIITCYSELIFSNAVYISDSSHEMYMSFQTNERDREIAEEIAYLKETGQYHSYPINIENNLVTALIEGDRNKANSLLNTLLGHIFFASDSIDDVKSRITELFVILCRGAIRGGANIDETLATNTYYLKMASSIKTRDALASWLAESLNIYINKIYIMLNTKYAGIIRMAKDYLDSHYYEAVSISDVASYTGYSISHFSRIFKEENGMSFKEYLNEFRVEKSKVLLLKGKLTTAQISSLIGFSDQSYFCKIFKKYTGISPNSFRKKVRRIDTTKEYGVYN